MSELSIYGSGMWKCIHRLSYLTYRDVLSHEKFNDMMDIVINVVPCQTCVDKSRAHHNLTRNDHDVFAAWWRHHNNVNESKGVDKVNLEIALENARKKASKTETLGLRYILFNTEDDQLHRIISKLL